MLSKKISSKDLAVALSNVQRISLSGLSKKHPGLTASMGDTFAEAASVCFCRFHTPPVKITVSCDQQDSLRIADYTAPNVRVCNAHANEIDATENGAYGVSLAVLENIKGLVAVKRAETLTGADWYVLPLGVESEDFEDCIRLEVSGISTGDSKSVQQRLRQKVEQTRRGASNLPAMAVVVGFQVREVAISKLEDKKE